MFPVNAYEDAAIVEGFAREFLHGKFSSLGVGNYLGYYPNNIGITLLFSFLYLFLPDNLLTLRFCNVIFSTLTAWLTYRLYKELFPNEVNYSCGVLLMTVCFLPAIILDNLTYGDTISTSLCTAGLLNSVRFVRTSLVKYAIYTALLLMLGNFTRSVALLFLLAVLVYWTLNSKVFSRTLNSKKVIAGIIIAIFAFSLPLRLFSFIGFKSGIIDEPVGIHANPIWRWINIGFPSDSKLGYWDGGRNTSIFVSRYKCDPKMASRFFIHDIIDKYENIGRKNTLKGYIKKTFWTWTEGTYNVNFYGLSQTLKPENFKLYNTPLIKYAEPGDKILRGALDWFLHTYNWITLALVAYYLWSCVKYRDFKTELLVYTILFYLGFYFFWEVKSRYLFGLYPILIILSYNSIGLIVKQGQRKFFH
ncbi:glycosyltransferase family 39 protein [Ruminiclostridium papyrosolvens]|uniref:glycosyltransferase family 39 protein n=1 Tax=Ruminiclostridium papyrosolvens TaxID=29362 RepID=UPI000426CD33|nr:glycosyltransferase family 39 protein [Ruminiclostridium papyrosolvens]